MQVADRLILYIREHSPAAVFIDAGQGQGVIDRVRQLGCDVTEIPFAGRAMEDARFLNRRAEMWYAVREWLQAGGCLPPDSSRLISELAAPTYSFNPAGKILLEPKEKIAERLGFSPDLADALALTFALPVMPVEQWGQASGRIRQAQTEYNILDYGMEGV
jgi:hypothetical protein